MENTFLNIKLLTIINEEETLTNIFNKISADFTDGKKILLVSFDLNANTILKRFTFCLDEHEITSNSDHVKNINGKNVGIIIISSASNTPVTFRKIAYIREGSYTKELNKEPAIEKQLWHKLNNSRFEEQFAKQDLELEDAIKLLEISSYFDLSKITIPANTNDIAYYLEEIKKLFYNKHYNIVRVCVLLNKIYYYIKLYYDCQLFTINYIFAKYKCNLEEIV